jgi:hypothetical protein
MPDRQPSLADHLRQAANDVAAIPDPELRKIAFTALVQHAGGREPWIGAAITRFSALAGVISVIVGVVLSVLSYNTGRQKEAEARIAEAKNREVEAKNREFEFAKYTDQQRQIAEANRLSAAKPLIDLRQKQYLEAIRSAAVLARPQDHTDTEKKEATKRFWELYWGELSLVEDRDVGAAMVRLGRAIDPNYEKTESQQAVLDLAYSLRNSLVRTWGVDWGTVGQVAR